MEWVNGGTNVKWLFYLGGFAGTGKTFLVQDIINSLDKKPHCLAPTGKAASVLQKKLKDTVVTTIHRAIYKPVMPDITELEALQELLVNDPGNKDLLLAIADAKRVIADEPLRFMDNALKEIKHGDLIVVDEASMVTRRMIEDLKATGAKVLFVGDPGQLPPVGDSGYFSNEEPDAMLSEVQRQALDNPIIALSMKVRAGDKCLWIIENDNILKRPKDGYSFEALAEADQVLTGTNYMRRRINRGVRKIKGINGLFYPQRGEKLICLKNQYIRGGWVVNGVHCVASGDAECDGENQMRMDVLYEEQLMQELPIYSYPFEKHYNDKAEEDPWPARHKLAEFDYGYAITVHKSQGSEWDRVVLVDDEMFGNDNKFRKRWLYTAITRAKEHLTWLTK